MSKINWSDREINWHFDDNKRLFKVTATPARDREFYITVFKDKYHSKFDHWIQGMIGEDLDSWIDYEKW